MRLLSIDLACETCGSVYDDIVDYEERNNPHPCKDPECEGVALRTYATAPVVSTSKMSTIMPECVAKGRFKHEIDQSHLRRDLTSARTKWSKDRSDKSKEEVTRLKKEVERTKRRR